MKIAQSLALFLVLGGSALAHDSWIEPRTYQASPRTPLPITFFVGHSGDQHSAKLRPRPAWLKSLQAHGPSGTFSLINSKHFTAAGVRLPVTGSYVLSLDTGNFENLAEPEKFGPYLEEEGLTASQKAWAAAPVRGRRVRETYRRHAKAVVQVGRGRLALHGPVTRRLGQLLEIVPEANPLALKPGQPLTGTIWYRDRPLAGALVTLGNLERPKDPLLKTRSDARGRYSFAMPDSGRWMLNVVWGVPTTRGADYQTSFSSLTFGVPARS